MGLWKVGHLGALWLHNAAGNPGEGCQGGQERRVEGNAWLPAGIRRLGGY